MNSTQAIKHIIGYFNNLNHKDGTITRIEPGRELIIIEYRIEQDNINVIFKIYENSSYEYTIQYGDFSINFSRKALEFMDLTNVSGMFNKHGVAYKVKNECCEKFLSLRIEDIRLWRRDEKKDVNKQRANIIHNGSNTFVKMSELANCHSAKFYDEKFNIIYKNIEFQDEKMFDENLCKL